MVGRFESGGRNGSNRVARVGCDRTARLGAVRRGWPFGPGSHGSDLIRAVAGGRGRGANRAAAAREEMTVVDGGRWTAVGGGSDGG